MSFVTIIALFSLLLSHILISFEKEDVPLTRGQKINRWASLGAEMVVLKDIIPRTEKQARKTPPKNLVEEKKKVQEAKKNLAGLYKRLSSVQHERTALEIELF